MPAEDHYHPLVVRLLIKDGWKIVTEQYKLIAGERRLWIDIQAAKAEQSLMILVEVKGFEKSPSAVTELAEAAGQYLVYQVALALNNLSFPLYLAVPEAAYQGILSEELGKQIRQQIGLKLLVFDPDQEVITRWIP